MILTFEEEEYVSSKSGNWSSTPGRKRQFLNLTAFQSQQKHFSAVSPS